MLRSVSARPLEGVEVDEGVGFSAGRVVALNAMIFFFGVG